MSVQTRFSTTLNGSITDVATTAVLDAAPAFTTGYGTFERGEALEEDFSWGNVSGLQLTGLLRGLSQTALTVTEVSGNKQTHDDEALVEGTLLHYIVNNKADLDENEAITGTWTFNTALPTSSQTPSSGSQLTTKTYVDAQVALKVGLTGNESIAGVKTFADDSARSTTNAAPSSELSFANKKYVDDQINAQVDNAVAVSGDDSSPGDMETKLVFGTHLSGSTNNPGANETRQINTDAVQTTSGASDANKLVATDDDGRIDNSLLSWQGTAGEAINGSSTPVCLCQASANYKHQISVHLNGDDLSEDLQWTSGNFATLNMGDTDATYKRGQSFTVTDSTADEITLEKLTIWMAKSASPTDNLSIEIMTDSGGSPDNTVIANGTSATIVGSTLTASNLIAVEFTWSTPPVLTSGQKYWFVVRRSGAIDGTNYYIVGYEAADNYSSHGFKTYTASAETWAGAGTEDLMFHAVFNMDYGNKIFKFDASNPAKCNYVGFTTDNVAADASLSINPLGVVMGGFTGLTEGATYYGSTGAGGFTTTNPAARGTAQVIVGEGRSATEMYLVPGKRNYSTLIATNQICSTEGTANHLYVTVPIGFKPKKTRLIVKDSVSGGDTSTYDSTWLDNYTPIAIVGVGATGGGTDTGEMVSTVSLAATNIVVTVNEVYDNALELDIYSANQNTRLQDIALMIEG